MVWPFSKGKSKDDEKEDKILSIIKDEQHKKEREEHAVTVILPRLLKEFKHLHKTFMKYRTLEEDKALNYRDELKGEIDHHLVIIERELRDAMKNKDELRKSSQHLMNFIRFIEKHNQKKLRAHELTNRQNAQEIQEILNKIKHDQELMFGAIRMIRFVKEKEIEEVRQLYNDLQNDMNKVA
ncbi:hypothetical protein ACFL1H_06495 [Nanoarchaeota archaeon]